MNKNSFKTSIIFIKVLLIIASAIFHVGLMAQQANEIFINEWLQFDKFQVNPPAFHSTENMKHKTFQNADLLAFHYLNIEKIAPKAGESLTRNGEKMEWRVVNSSKNGSLTIDRKTNPELFEIAYLANYIENDKWLELNLKIASPQLFEVYVNGRNITSKNTDDEIGAKETGNKQEKLKLEPGKHFLLIKSLKTPENKATWQISVSYTIEQKYLPAIVTTSSNPLGKKEIGHLMNGVTLSNASISPDGELVLLSMSEISPPDGTKTDWHEVRETLTGNLIQTFFSNNISNFQWMPSGRTLTYLLSKGKGKIIHAFDFERMVEREISGIIEDFGRFTWSPDGSFLIFSVSEKHDEKNDLVIRYENMEDRWPWWRTRSFLYRLDLTSGLIERLTYGFLSTSLEDIRPDGRKILFSQRFPDFNERPYSRQILFEMDLQNFAVDTILNDFYGGSFSYAPDGENLLVTGSASLFGGAGANVTGEVITNDYDTQAYIFNLSTGDINPITFNFNPSINQAIWSKYNPNIIHFLVTDRTYKHLFHYDLNKQYFEKIETGFDVISTLSVSNDQPLIVCTGSGISKPKFASVINTETQSIIEIANPASETYKNVVFGKTEDWNFENKNGITIEGSIYYPPDFDPTKKYPLIVYYYAGTTPSDRSFGGRYPKNLFAARGYVVYNLQPSGAIGWGQDFSAAHVNNWGITVADEIIDGTKLFIDQHPFVDNTKVGCIGASYGGFMTMLLQTRTDIFAAAISHAGISAISSYWGEGYWGYLYSSAASANSFPWNNRQLYIEQSAIYNADKINTPLLLLHGDSDTNVPPGESIQMFTALKLLGRPVELIEIKGQDHHILDYKKRIQWQKTILAWFDKWLKEQPEWWNDLYPTRNL